MPSHLLSILLFTNLMLVVVNDFLNFRYLNLIPNDFKYQSQRMYQVHCKLPFTVTNELVASPDSILDECFNGISGTDLVDALMNKTCSSITVLLNSVGGWSGYDELDT